MKTTSKAILFLIPFIGILLSNCTVTKEIDQAQKNEDLVRMWFEEGWNKNRNEELLEKCFHPDWTDGNPLLADQIGGYEGMRRLVNNYRNGTTNAEFKITHILSEGNQVAVRYEVTGTHSGDLFGVPASGNTFLSTGLGLYEFKDGRIHVSWQEIDLLGLLNQIRN